MSGRAAHSSRPDELACGVGPRVDPVGGVWLGLGVGVRVVRGGWVGFGFVTGFGLAWCFVVVVGFGFGFGEELGLGDFVFVGCAEGECDGRLVGGPLARSPGPWVVLG